MHEFQHSSAVHTRRFAHSLPDLPCEYWQELRNHLEAVASGALERANKFDAGVWGEAAGLLDDLGKYAAEWQAYLFGGPQVEHSSAGAQVAVQEYELRGRILAAVVAGHHAGLANGTDNGKRTALLTRLSAAVPDASTWRNEITLPALTPPSLKTHPSVGGDRLGLQLATLSRMIFSCLIRLERHSSVLRGSVGRLGTCPKTALFSPLTATLCEYLDNFQREATPSRLNRIRAAILAHGSQYDVR
jgi:CRISPR-associated endonuclease/helicase Cas3